MVERSRAAAGTPVPTGRATVTVPATSANLGPGFDTLGVALQLRDRVGVEARDAGPGPRSTVCEVAGEGAEEVPRGDDHLVVATLRQALAELAPRSPQPSITLTCHNVIPHGRGLGSSAAAVVAGLALAWELVHARPGDGRGGAAAGPPAAERLEWLVDRSSAIEGHGDNAAAAVLGGVIVSWSEAGTHRAHRIGVDPTLELVTAVPGTVLPTSTARAMLSSRVSRADAVFTAARIAMLVEALRGERSLLLAATDDRLHQAAREPAMPESVGLVRRLREDGLAAVVSGAGPSVLVLGADEAAVAAVAGSGWVVRRHTPGDGCAVVTPGDTLRASRDGLVAAGARARP